MKKKNKINPLHYFRNSKLVAFIAICFLFYSCSQYDLVLDKSFDYSIYESYKNDPLNTSTLKEIELLMSNKSTNSEIREQILILVNNQYKSNIDVKNSIWNKADLDLVEMKEYFLTNNLLTHSDIEILNDLSQNIQINGFENAMANFENKVVNLSLDQKTFDKFNTVANTLKIVDEIQQKKSSSKNLTIVQKNLFSCLIAFILWIAAIASLAACATVILCGLAIAAAIAATADLVAECVPNTPDGDLGDGPGNPLW